MTRRTALFALLAAGLVAAAPAARADDLSFGDALATAMEQAPEGAVLVKARVESGGYGFYFWKRPGMIEIEVSKNSAYKKLTKKVGGAVSQDVLDLMDKMVKGKTKLPDGRIFEIATKSLNGTPLTGLNYQIVDDRLVAVVGGNQIDAQTGKVTAVK